MYVNPSTSFEATAEFATGLTGTLGVRITDNEGNTTTPRATAGITEYPAGSGLYAVTLTSPGTAGQYSLAWKLASTGEIRGVDDLTVVEMSSEIAAQISDEMTFPGQIKVTVIRSFETASTAN